MAQHVDHEPRNAEQYLAGEQPASLENERVARPLSAILAALPQQYLRAVTKPTLSTYREVGRGASWRLVWIQLLIWAVLDAALGTLVNYISLPASAFGSLFALATSVGLVVLVPVLFFLIMGIAYAIARALGGQGTFLEQCYTSLYVEVPLGIGSKLLALIPVVGRILNSVLSLYGIVLQVIVLVAVHREDKGR